MNSAKSHSEIPAIGKASSASSYMAANSKLSSRIRIRRHKSIKALIELWILASEIYAEAGKLEQAWQAVEEAENVDNESACVLRQVGSF